jgi:hypothetical protein
VVLGLDASLRVRTLCAIQSVQNSTVVGSIPLHESTKDSQSFDETQLHAMPRRHAISGVEMPGNNRKSFLGGPGAFIRRVRVRCVRRAPKRRKSLFDEAFVHTHCRATPFAARDECREGLLDGPNIVTISVIVGVVRGNNLSLRYLSTRTLAFSPSAVAVALKPQPTALACTCRTRRHHVARALASLSDSSDQDTLIGDPRVTAPWNKSPAASCMEESFGRLPELRTVLLRAQASTWQPGETIPEPANTTDDDKTCQGDGIVFFFFFFLLATTSDRFRRDADGRNPCSYRCARSRQNVSLRGAALLTGAPQIIVLFDIRVNLHREAGATVSSCFVAVGLSAGSTCCRCSSGSPSIDIRDTHTHTHEQLAAKPSRPVRGRERKKKICVGRVGQATMGPWMVAHPLAPTQAGLCLLWLEALV